MNPALQSTLNDIAAAPTVEEVGRRYEQYCKLYLQAPFEIYQKLVAARDRRIEELNKA